MHSTISEISHEQCVGCGACSARCPKHCIQMREDNEGFLFPQINEKDCIQCGMCLRVCPASENAEKLKNREDRRYFCGYVKDDAMLKKSSSGGVFGTLANAILSDGGLVCGCTYDKNMKATHVLSDDSKQIQSMYGSKYVQSEIASSFEQIQKQVTAGRTVLFTGTACQIAALRLYLAKEYENLYCVEILCHGVPSPGLFRCYVEYLERKLGGRISDIQFRNKEKKGWGSEHRTCVMYEKKRTKRQYRPTLPAYFSAFFYGLNLRESCYRCRFACPNRVADLTIGDFWGSWAKYHERFQQGISVVGINSEKGSRLFDAIREQFSFCEELEEKEAIRSNDNFEHPVKRPAERNFIYNGTQKKYRGFWKKVYPARSCRKKVLASFYGAFVPAAIRYKLHRKH